MAGVIAVAVDLWLTRRSVRSYESRTKTIYLEGIFDPGGAVAHASLEGGREPTMSERLDLLEREVGRLRDEFTQKIETLRDGLRKRMELTAERVSQAIRDDVEALDALLRGVTTGGIALRVVGGAFVLLGIGLSVWGSLLRT